MTALAKSEHTLAVHVECYAGHRGEQTPRRFRLGPRAVDVTEVRDQWLAPDHRYFKVQGGDNATYILRHDTAAGTWDLVMYQATGVAPP